MLIQATIKQNISNVYDQIQILLKDTEVEKHITKARTAKEIININVVIELLGNINPVTAGLNEIQLQFASICGTGLKLAIQSVELIKAQLNAN